MVGGVEGSVVGEAEGSRGLLGRSHCRSRHGRSPRLVGLVLWVGRPRHFATKGSRWSAALCKPLKAGQRATLSVSVAAATAAPGAVQGTSFSLCTLSNARPHCSCELACSPADGAMLHLSAPPGCAVHLSCANGSAVKGLQPWQRRRTRSTHRVHAERPKAKA